MSQQIFSGATVVYTSRIGAISDADLSMEASTSGITDNTPAIQRALDEAGPSRALQLIVDGRYGVRQLIIGGNTTVECLPGCGFIQLDDSNVPCVWNRNPSTTDISDENISIIGGTWNFNGYQQGAPRQHRSSSEGLTMGFKFAGVRNVRFRDVSLINCRTIHSFFWNFYDVVFENITVEMCTTASAPYNIDGIDFQTGRFLTIRNLVATCKDDVINIGANNGFHPTFPLPHDQIGVTDYEPFASYGPISDVTIDGVVIKNSPIAGIRLISRDQLVDNVTIRNVSGVTGRNWLIIDNYAGWTEHLYAEDGAPMNGNFGTISIENTHMAVVSPGLPSAYAYINAHIRTLRITADTRYDFDLPGYPSFLIDRESVIDNLIVRDVVSAPSSNDVNDVFTVKGHIRDLSIAGCTHARDASPDDFPVVRVEGGRIDTLRLSEILTRGANHVVDISSGSVGHLSVNGVVQQGGQTLLRVAEGAELGTSSVAGYHGPSSRPAV